jgi:hypothetical protein
MNLKNTISFFIISLTVLTSCINGRKIDRQIAKYYSVPSTKTKNQNDVAFVASNLQATNNEISTTETKTTNFKPFIVYWSWDYKNTSTLNPKIPTDNFTKAFLTATSRLKDKLNGATIELTIEKIPNMYSMHDKMHLIFFLYEVHWENVFLQGENMDAVFSYKIIKAGSEVKNGSITIPYQKDKHNLGFFQSWKKATDNYLADYDLYISSLGKTIADRIVKELP